MDRLVLFIIACTAQVGCQSPVAGFDPFAVGRQTRVPPPPTGVIGRASEFNRTRAPAPPINAGAANQAWPATQYEDVGRYWESASNEVGTRIDQRVAQQPAARPQRRVTPQSPTPGGLAQNDRLTWRDPNTNGIPGPLPSYSELSSGEPTVGTVFAPRLLPRTGPVSPIVSSPPRVRGFSNSYGRQDIHIPAELAEFQHSNGVRQASTVSSNWQPRYDDVRR